MKLSDLTTRDMFYDSLAKECESQKDGHGLTKQEFAGKFGFSSLATVDKWVRRYPKLREYLCYVPTNEGKHRMAIFTNKKYRDELVRTKQATEYY